MRVLILDENKVDRFILRKLLHPDTEVIAPVSAKEAVSLAMQNAFDVCLINVLPGCDMERITLLRDLRSAHPGYFTAVAITWHISFTSYTKLLQAGFKGVMLKPFDKEKFFKLIKRNSETVIAQAIRSDLSLYKRVTEQQSNWSLN